MSKITSRSITICLAVFTVQCMNVTHGISGTVVDQMTQLPVEGARVSLQLYDFADDKVSGEDPVLITDKSGVYSWSDTNTMILFQGGGGGIPAKAKLSVSKDGYTTYAEPDFIKLSEATTYNVALWPSP